VITPAAASAVVPTNSRRLIPRVLAFFIRFFMVALPFTFFLFP
jgi:hypothetical protein